MPGLRVLCRSVALQCEAHVAVIWQQRIHLGGRWQPRSWALAWVSGRSPYALCTAQHSFLPSRVRN